MIDMNEKYCSTCGRALRQNQFINHYDSESGKPVYFTKLKCPVLFPFDFHTEIILNDSGEEHIERFW